MTVFCLLLLKKTCVRPLSERETYRRFTLVVFLYWRKSYNCSDVLAFAYVYRKNIFVAFTPFLTLCFFLEGNPITVLRYLVFAISVNWEKMSYRENMSSLYAPFLFLFPYWRKISPIKKGKTEKKGKNPIFMFSV